jgi:hypothetical protein
MDFELLDMLEEARFRLYVHGILTDSENDKVETKIKKKCDKAGLAVVKKGFFEK